MFVYKVRVFFPRPLRLMCSVLLLYLLIVLHNCKKHSSNFMIRLLLPESKITLLPIRKKTRVFLKVTKFLMFLLGGFLHKFSGLKRYSHHPNI